MRARKYICRLTALSALITTTLAAQTAGDWDAVRALLPGTQVRINVGTRTLRGVIGSTSGDAFTLTSNKKEETLDRRQVSAVFIRKPGHRRRNTLIGLAIGAGAGLGIGLASRTPSGQWEIIPDGVVIGVLIGLGSLIGTIAGVLIPTGGWSEIYRQ